MKMIKRVILWAVLLLMIALPVLGADLEYKWDENPEADKYEIFMSLTSEVYDLNSPVWSGTGTTAVIPGLEFETTYYAKIRACNECGNCSELSPELIQTTAKECGVMIWTGGGQVRPY